MENDLRYGKVWKVREFKDFPGLENDLRYGKVWKSQSSIAEVPNRQFVFGQNSVLKWI